MGVIMNHPLNLYDAVIVGGGPAGTSVAIHLAASGARVLLAEQKLFPRAKLCGEFISPECLKHFERLGVAEKMADAGGAELMETVFYSRNGRRVSVPTEWFGSGAVRALGLSRAEMDARLLTRAHEVGVCVLDETKAVGLLMDKGHVRGVRLQRRGEVLESRSLITIDASGRSRALARRIEKEQHPKRRRRKASAPLVAFKAHLENANGAPDACEIYLYRGGYGGLSRVESGLSNLCFIASARDVRTFGGDPEKVMRAVVLKNSRAAHTLAQANVRTGWLAVALEEFGQRSVHPASGMLTVGDAASFIDPFTGSGMLMALESGELAARTIVRHLSQLGSDDSIDKLACDYRTQYDEMFGARLRVSALMRSAAFVPRLAELLIVLLSGSERARRFLARSTRRTRGHASVRRSI